MVVSSEHKSCKSKAKEETLMEIALDAGAEDINSEGENYDITCDIASFQKGKDAITAKGIPIATAEMTKLPSTYVRVVGDEARSLLSLMEALEEQEDVQNVYANFDIPDEEMDKITQ